VFRLHLSTAYITTAKINIRVFYCLFQDNIAGFSIWFPIRCLGFYCCLCISYAAFLVMIFLIIAQHPLVFSHSLFGIYLVGFQGQTCSHLCFLDCFPYDSLAHMAVHFSIKVLPPTWLRRIKNRDSYQSLLHLLAKGASQPPTYLRSIIHIE